jgi:lipooligosaccharide transport system permease protein
MSVMGLAGSIWVIACLPTALLIGFAFAAVGLAGCSYARSWADFTWVEAIMVPLFLFSATFYPLSVYSPAAQWIVRLTPLYHGVAMCRAFSAGELSWGLLGDAAYLLAMGAIGLIVSSRRLGVLLLK